MTVETIMVTNVTTVSSTDSFSSVQKLFKDRPFHHLLVEDEGKFVGVITDRDMISQIHNLVESKSDKLADEIENLCVSDLQSQEIIQIDSSTRIEAAAILLLENKVSCLPVINSQEEIEGIVTWQDILKYYVYK